MTYYGAITAPFELSKMPINNRFIPQRVQEHLKKLIIKPKINWLKGSYKLQTKITRM
jgi:hypothetical protein